MALGKNRRTAGMSAPRIYLLRHGETEWSRLGRHTGRSEIPLTPAGETQARAAGGRLRDVVFDWILVSPRVRARRTAELAGLADRAVAAAIEPALQEWDYGDYEGLKRVEILEKNPQWNIYRDGCPGGETPAAITARADSLAERLRARGGKIALVSHGHFLRVFGARWVGWPIEACAGLGLDTATLGVLGCEHDDVSRPLIMRWNLPPTGEVG